MRYEPPIDRARLMTTIRDRYGLAAESLAFVPVGYAAACYVLRLADGGRRFLKLWPDPRSISADAARRETVLRLARALHDRDLYPRVPYPIPTHDGALSATLDSIPFALFPFLPGHPPPSPWPPALWDEFARTVAAIHRATPALADVLPPRDTFDITLETELLHGLDAIERIGRRDRPGHRALRDLILPRRDDILAQLARLHRLRQTVRQLPGPAVLCHTDIGGDNLLVDDTGQLSVLDWDEATVAPPEHDLQEARQGDFGRFLAVYLAAGGARPLHLDHFAFYLLRRHVGDMTVRLLSVLDEDATPERDADALHGIQAWGFQQWDTLEESLDRIASALRRLDP